MIRTRLPDIDVYRLLGVSRTASQADIKRAYRKMTKEWHPDLAHGFFKHQAEVIFRQINRGYETLSDPADRFDYDQMTSRMGFQYRDSALDEFRSAYPWVSNTKGDPSPKDTHLKIIYGIYNYIKNRKLNIEL